MSDTLLPVPSEWKSRAFIDAAEIPRDVCAARVRTPDGFWREQAARIDWIKPFTKVKNVSWDPDNLFIKWFEDGTLNVAANCIDRHLPKRGRPDRDHLGRRRSQRHPSTSPIRSCTTRSAASPMCCEGARRQERRPRHHLSADDPGSGLRDAGLRAHRRGAFGGVRRLLAGQPGRPHPRLRDHDRHHRRRRPARRQARAAEGQHRCWRCRNAPACAM